MQLPEHLSFAMDRMSILDAAHKMLTRFEVDYDVSDLLDVAGWLAGDQLPDSPYTAPVVPDMDEGTEVEGAEDA